MLLADRRLLITGVLTERSIAYAVAERAQREGAEVVLTGFGRAMRLTQRIAKRLPTEPEVLELDVNDPAQITALAGEIDTRWGRLDGVLHAIAFVPPDALGGRFMDAPAESAMTAIQTSAVSLQQLASGLAPLLERSPYSASLVGLDFDARVAWPAYDWAGVSKAALESVNRYVARDLGPRGVRCNLVAAGPLRTMAAKSIEGFDGLSQIWEQSAPLGWDLDDATPVADTCVFLLSDLARAVTGSIVYADGGVHAVGAPVPAAVPASATTS
jgi:enoyl-[acyl-carrier protein] reductase I